MKVAGLRRLVVVSPEHLARTDHPNAIRMAVGAQDILKQCEVVSSVASIASGWDVLVATTARRGQRRVLAPEDVAHMAAEELECGKSVAILFGGERGGLRRDEVERCTHTMRIPMVGNEPSLNLAQAVMITAYELMKLGLRKSQGSEPPVGTDPDANNDSG